MCFLVVCIRIAMSKDLDAKIRTKLQTWVTHEKSRGPGTGRHGVVQGDIHGVSVCLMFHSIHIHRYSHIIQKYMEMVVEVKHSEIY